MPHVPGRLLLGARPPDRVRATSYDTADYGIRDLAIYTELGLPAEHRSIREDASDDDLRQDAVAVVRDWTNRYRRTGIHKTIPGG
jgi:hypothetical protein